MSRAAPSATAEAALLEVEIEVRRRALAVVAEFSLAPGERLSLFGPSGAGKTTVLESVAGLVRLERGTVRLGGRLVASARRRGTVAPPRQRQVALVRQPTTLFPHLTVAQNVAYGAAVPDLASLLERLGVAELARSRAGALSGGQRQRVALGRALASRFRVLLLDEPFSALDGRGRADLRRLAAEVASEREAAAVLVTHDLAEAQGFAETLAVIDAGRLLALGPSDELVQSPPTRRVAELLGYRGFLPVAGREGYFVAIHPERVVPGPAEGRGVELTGEVVGIHPCGTRYECELLLAGGERVFAELERAPAPGSRIVLAALGPPIVAA